jgi:hypothetical protein
MTAESPDNCKCCCHCHETIHTSAKVCHHCGRHQNLFWEHFRIEQVGLLISMVMLIIAISQLNDARTQRSEAEQALNEANQARDAASQAAENAGQAYRKTDLLLSQITAQKKLIELWGMSLSGIFYNENKFAIENLEAIAQLDSDNYFVYFISGNLLGHYAERCGNNGDSAKERQLLDKAETQFLKTESLKKGFASYKLANIAAYRGQENDCRKWLTLAADTNNLPPASQASIDRYFDSVRQKDWFTQIPWPKAQ